MEKNQPTEDLFSVFPPITKGQWKEKVISDLKGADFEKKLVWHPAEPFKVDPYFTAEDLADLQYLRHYHGAFYSNSGTRQAARHWSNREKILVNDPEIANALAVEALNGGADGILFDLSGQEDTNLRLLLGDIPSRDCSISFLIEKDADRLINEYFSLERDGNSDITKVSGSLNYDPIQSLCLKGHLELDGFEKLPAIIDVTDGSLAFYGLTINGSQFQNSGSNVTQELAFILNIAVDYLDKLGDAGIHPEKVLRNLECSLSVGSSYFLEIAKLRALRILFYQLATRYGVETFDPGRLHVHSTSSIWSKTLYDPYVNMLRNTTEAMAAIIGGCNALTVAPYDDTFQTPNEFSKRIARNTSIILREESYFDKVADPSAGSYYIEFLTDQLVRHAWELFKEVESEGGFIASFREGKIQSRIAAIREDRDNRIANRKRIVVGTNQYPHTQETVDPDLLETMVKDTSEAKPEVLAPRRGAGVIEDIRLDTERYVRNEGKGRRPGVYLCLIGSNAAMRSARAGFSAGFLGCAGFRIVEGPIEPNFQLALEKASRSECEIVVFCGADEDYLEQGVALARKYKASNPDSVLLIAGYPRDLMDRLEEAGIDLFIHLRASLADSLRKIQKTLRIIK